MVGELVMVAMLLELGQELTDRRSNGAGESIDVTDMVSKSGVQGSR